MLCFVCSLGPLFRLRASGVLRSHLGSNMASFSPTTQEFLAKWSLQAITLYYLREDEVMLLERERPGAQLAWKEIVRRDRPAAPAVPFLFKPENYRSEPGSEAAAI